MSGLIPIVRPGVQLGLHIALRCTTGNTKTSLVENDEPDNHKGYDWKKLKNAISKDITLKNVKKNDPQIPDDIKLNSVYIRTSDSVAFSFIKYLRHAFAHNYVEYDEKKKIIEIDLPNKFKTSSTLKCKISYNNLKQMVEILKQQKQKTTGV